MALAGVFWVQYSHELELETARRDGAGWGILDTILTRAGA